MAQWKERGNVWPPNWQEETPAFKANMVKREKELELITGSLERWENYMQYTQSRSFVVMLIELNSIYKLITIRLLINAII